MEAMTMRDKTSSHERTTAAMHATAQQLEQAESILHRSAQATPNRGSKARLHGLGDQVTALADDIAERADRLSDGGDRFGRQPGARHADQSPDDGRSSSSG
jgi:hypothetical protein